MAWPTHSCKLCLPTFLRRFDMSLDDVIYERDVMATRDCSIGEPNTREGQASTCSAAMFP